MEVAQAIVDEMERCPEGQFNMRDVHWSVEEVARWGFCGTAQCISGFATQADVQVEFIQHAGSEREGTSAHALLTVPTPEMTGYDYLAHPHQSSYISREHAVACLLHWGWTGEVDWYNTDPARGA